MADEVKMEAEKSELRVYNKWNSRRWIICVWVMLMSTVLMVWSLITQKELSWVGMSLPILLGIIGVYIGAESYTKTHRVL